MALVDSLLGALARADGEALVVHVGEKPYIVAPAGQIELSREPVTLEAVWKLLEQLLPAEGRKVLEQLGAVEQELTSPAAAAGEKYTVVAARGGDDIWLEIRRHRRVAAPAAAPATQPAAAVGSPTPQARPVTGSGPARPVAPPLPVVPAPVQAESPVPPRPSPAVPARATVPVVQSGGRASMPAPVVPAAAAVPPPPRPPAVPTPDARVPAVQPPSVPPPARPAPPSAAQPPPSAQPGVAPRPLMPAAALAAPTAAAPVESRIERPAAGLAPAGGDEAQAPQEPAGTAQPAVVLPMARSPIPPRGSNRVPSSPRLASVERLLRLAAARGASMLYLTSGARPAIRVDGEMMPLESEPPLDADQLESLILEVVPERSREALRSGEITEWITEVPDVGRVRCVIFRDHRGPGVTFRMIATRAVSAEQLGLSRELHELCLERDGLIVVTGPRASGKSTLLSAFIDLVNRARRDLIVTLETQIAFVHDNRNSIVSQREIRGGQDALLVAARAALREDPDVLVIEDFGSADLVSVALEAAESGHLVIGTLTAPSTTAAVGRLIDLVPADRRPQFQNALAETLRGVVAQVLLRKSAGGRVAARELLLNTHAVATLVAEGKISQLPAALDSGRRQGMVPLNDALVAFVQSGVIEAREAYRKASDRQGFLNRLRREGIDTSFVERLA